MGFPEKCASDVLSYLRTDIGCHVTRLFPNITEWLDTENDDLIYSPCIFYSVSRSQSVYQALQVGAEKGCKVDESAD